MVALSVLLDTGVGMVLTAPRRTLETRPSSSSRPSAYVFPEADANDSPSVQILIAQSPAEGLPEIAAASAFLTRDSSASDRLRAQAPPSASAWRSIQSSVQGVSLFGVTMAASS
jgi:hypothetical protein